MILSIGILPAILLAIGVFILVGWIAAAAWIGWLLVIIGALMVFGVIGGHNRYGRRGV